MRTLGVLGGMGPAATADFLARLAGHTPAGRDQEHLPTVVYSDPTTPDRSDAILAGGASPVPAMVRGVDFLDRAGVEAIAIPCNTAHQWYDELVAATSVPILHIVDAVLARIEREAPGVSAIGLLATTGTVHAGIYHRRLAGTSVKDIVDLNDLGDENPVMAGIRAVKAGEPDRGRELLAMAGKMLVSRGAMGLVYGCTDVSAVLDGAPAGVDVAAWDSSDALAIACVDRFYNAEENR